MTKRTGYVFVQAILIGLCLLCALFILIHERILFRHVARNFELPYLGATALLYRSELFSSGETHALRSFEERNNIQVFFFDNDRNVLYPPSVSPQMAHLLDHAQARIVLQGYGQLYEQDGTNGYTIWGIRDRTDGGFVFVVPEREGVRVVPRPETRGPAVFFSLMFCSFAGVVFILIRRIFRDLDRSMEKNRNQIIRLQAVMESQACLVRNAQVLMYRCGSQLKERDPNDLAAEELLNRSHYLENSRRILQESLFATGVRESFDRISVYSLCARVQSMIADELSDSGIVIRLNEVQSGLKIRGKEGLLLLALEDLFIRLIPAVPAGGIIIAVVSGAEHAVCLDITVPSGDMSFHPAGVFLSAFLFGLMGIRLGYQTDENGDLVIHTEFQDSGE